jgi:Family of unknown function (DUF6325)
MTDATAKSTGQVELDELDVMGPIDLMVVEFPHRKTPGEGVKLFVDLVDRGIIRVLDLAFVRKEEDGSVRRLKLADLGPVLAVFEGAGSGLVDDEDVNTTAEALEPDSAAVILVYENQWAGPLARAMRRGGGQLVVSERLPIQAILAALDATEASEKAT